MSENEQLGLVLRRFLESNNYVSVGESVNVFAPGGVDWRLTLDGEILLTRAECDLIEQLRTGR